MEPRTRRWLESSLLSTDLARGLRASIALAAGWGFCLLAGQPGAAMYVAPTAQSVALPDVRGDYQARLLILLCLSIVLTLSAVVGTIAAGSVAAATLSMGGLALLAGCWRHLSGDYGPQFALGSALLFFIGLSQPGDLTHAFRVAAGAGLGSLGGILIQLSGWFVRPQHPLRHAVAETWVAASDLITALRPLGDNGGPRRPNLGPAEATLRTTVDRTLQILAAADREGRRKFVKHLDELAHFAARLATRAAAFHTALDALSSRPEFTALQPAIDSAYRSLANAARSAALNVITHRAEQLLAFEVRLRRATTLLRVLDERLAGLEPRDSELAQARELLSQLVDVLSEIHEGLGQTVDHSADSAGFTLRLPDLSGLSIRSLGAWLNPARQIDPVLVRYTWRVTVLLMCAVAGYEYFQIPRGYWIPFTALVVLQPDYGATRKKAGQRIAGTLAGSIVASLLLWIKLPPLVLLFCASIMAFFFGWFVRKRYGLAVFFVTIMIVLVVEVVMPVHLDFTVARLLSTLAGGTLALLAALLFWPKWEQEQFPAILGRALRANRQYLEAVATQLIRAEPFRGEAVRAKREAERANSEASASLQRMLAEPTWRRGNIEQAGALVTNCQRLTRALTVLAQHLNKRQPVQGSTLSPLVAMISEAIETLAVEIAEGRRGSRPIIVMPQDIPPNEAILYSQLGRIITEIEAISLETEPGPLPTRPPPRP